MPNARVGAMPQPVPQSDQDLPLSHQPQTSRGRGRRQQGISMQDLKQQTAVRLAQEQSPICDLPVVQSQGQECDTDLSRAERSIPAASELSARSSSLHSSSNDAYEERQHSNSFRQRVQLYQGASGDLHHEVPGLLMHAQRNDLSSNNHRIAENLSASALRIDRSNETLNSFSVLSRDALSSPSSQSPGVPRHDLVVSVHHDTRSAKDTPRGHRGSVGSTNNVKDASVAQGSNFGQVQQMSQSQQARPARLLQPKSQKKKYGRQQQVPDFASPSTTPKKGQIVQHQVRAGKQSVHLVSSPIQTVNKPNQLLATEGKATVLLQMKQNASKQSKLPHGLTVQELKEMTKARLAAEASESDDIEKHPEQQRPFTIHDQPNRLSPGACTSTRSFGEPQRQEFRFWQQQQQLVRGRLNSAESASSEHYLRQRLNSTESTASAPPAVIFSQSQGSVPLFRTISHHSLNDKFLQGAHHHYHHLHHQQQHLQRFRSLEQQPFVSNVSSLSANLVHGYCQQHGSDHHDRFVAKQKNDWRQFGDSMENASVTSMNSGLGSEYFGSESAHNSNNLGQSQSASSAAEEASRYQFGRSRSYPVGASIGQAIENNFENTLSVATSSSLFESPMALNRRRAATTSPSGLSHLMEDRPMKINNTGDFSIPEFDFPRHARNPPLPPGFSDFRHVEFSPYPNESRVSSPADSRIGSNSQLGEGSWSDLFQRPSSAATIPTVAPSGDSFGGNDEDTLFPLAFGVKNRAMSSGGVSISADLPNSVAESVLGTPLLNDGKKLCFDDSLDGQGVLLSDSGDNDGLSSVFRSANSDRHNVQLPGMEMTLTSTSSGGVCFHDGSAVGHRNDFGTEVTSMNSWGGTFRNFGPGDISAGDTGYNELQFSRLEDNVKSLLTISDRNAGGMADHRHHRAPSLVSKIDPELNTSDVSMSRSAVQTHNPASRTNFFTAGGCSRPPEGKYTFRPVCSKDDSTSIALSDKNDEARLTLVTTSSRFSSQSNSKIENEKQSGQQKKEI